MAKQKPLKNLLSVIKYLEANGWQVSKSAVYRHRKAGLIVPDVGKQFSIKLVNQYAHNHLTKFKADDKPDKVTLLPPTVKQITGDQIAHAKRVAELKKLDGQARHWVAKAKVEEGNYIKKDLFERSLAQRAAIFKSDIEAFIRSYASEMIHLVDGDDVKTPDLIDFWLEKSAVWLGRYTDARL
jgi:hypothetical protein